MSFAVFVQNRCATYVVPKANVLHAVMIYLQRDGWTMATLAESRKENNIQYGKEQQNCSKQEPEK